MSDKDTFTRLKKRISCYISQYPIPTATENNKRFITLRLIKDKESNQYQELRDYIIISNGGFALFYATKYCKLINDDSIIDDIFQQAQMGIVEATDRYDPARGVNFTTFAYYYVKKCIIDYIKRYKIVLAPREIAKNMKTVSEIQDKLFSENRIQPTAKEIQKCLLKDKEAIVKESTIDDVLKLRGLTSADTNDSFMRGLTNDLEDENGDHEMAVFLKALSIKELVGLDDICIKFIMLRFGIDEDRPFNLAEIKLLMSLTNEEIEEIKTKILTWYNNKIVMRKQDKYCIPTKLTRKRRF